MKKSDFIFAELYGRYPQLDQCRVDIEAAFELLLSAYRGNGKVLVCGNGGSASDAEHICGELLKCFNKKRPVPAEIAAKLDPALASRLEGSLPAVSLVSMSGIVSAFQLRGGIRGDEGEGRQDCRVHGRESIATFGRMRCDDPRS